MICTPQVRFGPSLCSLHTRGCAEYLAKDGFPAARDRVEKIAVHIQNRISKAVGTTEETAAGLELLRRTRGRPEEMEIYSALIAKGYSLKWSAAQKGVF